MSVSYRQYFTDSLSRQFGPGHRPTQAEIDTLVASIESHLRERGYDEQVIAAEAARARQEGAELVAPQAPPPRRAKIAVDSKTRRYAIRTLIAIGLLIAYVLPLVLFFTEDQSISSISTAEAQLTLGLRISVVELAREQVTFQMTPSSGALVGPDGRLLKDVSVQTDPGTGMISHVFKAELPLTPWTITAATDSGDILDFPFDSYEVDLDIDAKSDGQPLRLKTTLLHVPHGLSAKHTESPIEGGGTNVVVRVSRTGTIMFVALLATLSLLLVTSAACLVAWQVWFHGRKIEFSMMVWVAALLFVIPTVRNSLPGGVPPGALIDFLLFFWLQVAAVTAMGALVLSWARRTG